jgi:uncharacterized protein
MDLDVQQSGTGRAGLDVIVRMFHSVDALDWDGVRACLADELATDYTALWGGEPERTTPDGLVAAWGAVAPGYDATQHLLGPFEVTAEGDGSLSCTSGFRAFHHLRAECLRGTWLVAGRYHFVVARTGDRWRITAITLDRAYEDGDRAIVDAARERVAAGAGGRVAGGRPGEASVRRFHELLAVGDLDGWAALWHEDARITTPYAVAGFDREIVGRDAIVAAFRSLFAHFRSYRADLLATYPTADGDAVCVEYRNHVVLSDGTEYHGENIAVHRFRDGLLVAYHDYFDPRRFQQVVDVVTRT